MIGTIIDLLCVVLLVYFIYVLSKWSKFADELKRELEELKDEVQNETKN